MSVTLSESVPAAPVAIEPPSMRTHYDEIADQFIAAIKAAADLIPAFVAKHPESERFVQRYRGFPDALIPTTMAAVQECPELESTGKFDVEDARAAQQFMRAIRPAIDAVNDLGTNLQFTRDARKAMMIASSLQIYAIAKGIGRDASSAKVAGYVAIMKRDMNRPGRKRKKTAKRE